MATSKKQQAAIAISMKAKGNKPKMKPGGSLGNKSVESGYDNNSGVTRADFVAMGKGQAKMGGSGYADKFAVSMKKGGSINKTAGKTTTSVTSNYKGYKGPKSQNPKAKVKKAKGKL